MSKAKIKPSTMEGFLATQGVSSVIPLLHHHNYIIPPKTICVKFFVITALIILSRI